MARGGKRAGAGRPTTDRERLTIHVTARERVYMLMAMRAYRGLVANGVIIEQDVFDCQQGPFEQPDMGKVFKKAAMDAARDIQGKESV